MPPSLIVRTNSEFRQYYHRLGKGDVVACLLNLGPREEYLLVDLLDRGVLIFPPAVAQLASRSKCFQAVLFRDLMPNHTLVIRNRTDLIKAMDLYSSEGIGPVVTKLDRADCGLGINRWQGVEELYNQVVFSKDPPWPFVLQPFLPEATDIRVIWLGERYREAYWRKNPYSFRNNIHFGASSGVYQLGEEERSVCQRALERGRFPFAHIDLLRLPGGEIYLSEISLFGGLKGASMDIGTCNRIKREIEEDFLAGL